MYKVYKVISGDNLNNLSERFNISIEELTKLNGLNNDSKLVPGMFLVVPSNRNNFKNYTVEKGDTLYSIAKNSNIDLETLLLINGLDSNDYIYPGENLLIPNENINILITKDGDTVNDLANYNLNDLLNLNSTIYLLPNQLIFYLKRE